MYQRKGLHSDWGYTTDDGNEKGRAQHGPDWKCSSASPELCFYTTGLGTLLSPLHQPTKNPTCTTCFALQGTLRKWHRHKTESCAMQVGSWSCQSAKEKRKHWISLSNNAACTRGKMLFQRHGATLKKDKDLQKVNHTEGALKTDKWAGNRRSVLWLVPRQSSVNLHCIKPANLILQQKRW